VAEEVGTRLGTGCVLLQALQESPPSARVTTSVDTLIIGAGYAGLGAGLYLAEQGKSVAICEALKYPGGCASTFYKGDLGFEAGATLFSGFHEQGLFRRWIDRHNMPVEFELLDPIIDFRTADWRLQISPDRQTTIDRFCALPGAPQAAIRSFFAYQHRIAEVLWPMFEDGDRVPPFTLKGLGWHAGRAWKYPKLWSVMNRSLWSVLESYGLTSYAPMVQYCNAVCQITIQTTARDSEALFALSAMDYLFRGTGHIHNGIGQLGFAFVNAIRACGGEVSLSNRVKRLERQSDGWLVQTRQRSYRARRVLANLLPGSISKLVEGVAEPDAVQQYTEKLRQGWGAGMLYLLLKDHEGLPESAHHYQCIATHAPQLHEGHHIFCSLSGRSEREKCPEGYRTATVSTHIPMRTQLSLPNAEAQATYTLQVQDCMRATLKARLPEVHDAIHTEHTASPRTYQRFTGRPSGCVGGIPRTRGWHNYSGLLPAPLYPNLWMIGDTVFPGQSTLATALGGIRVARWVG